jgi:uncharacterized lipoprotein
MYQNKSLRDKNLYLVSILRVVSITVLLSILTATLTACGAFGGDERPVYQGAEYYKNLEIPPDLTAPDTSRQLGVPQPSAAALQNFIDNNELSSTVSPTFDGVRIVNEAGNSWVEIDKNVDTVWADLIGFWQNEGVELVEKRPLLGFMETDWVERLEADVGFFRGLFQRFEPDEKDKFRVRVSEKGSDATRVSVAHSRIELVSDGEFADEVSWRSRPSDVEAEREIISRIALYAGLNQSQSNQLAENYRRYTSLVEVDKTNAIALTMKGDKDFVWQRAMRALDRMGMKDILEQKENNSIYFTAAKVSDEALDIEEDEIAKSSWLMQWFSGSGDKNSAENIDRQYHLELTELADRVQIEIKDVNATQTSDDDGNVEGTALAEQLRNILVVNLE